MERWEGNAVGSQSQTKMVMPSISLIIVHHGNVAVNGSMSNVTFKFESDGRVVIDEWCSVCFLYQTLKLNYTNLQMNIFHCRFQLK